MFCRAVRMRVSGHCDAKSGKSRCWSAGDCLDLGIACGVGGQFRLQCARPQSRRRYHLRRPAALTHRRAAGAPRRYHRATNELWAIPRPSTLAGRVGRAARPLWREPVVHRCALPRAKALFRPPAAVSRDPLRAALLPARDAGGRSRNGASLLARAAGGRCEVRLCRASPRRIPS
jgi:hypothetical protein